VYADGPDVAPDDQVVVDPDAGMVVLDAFARGDAAMRAFAPDQQPGLWPEHFDVGITLAEVNYGVSPGRRPRARALRLRRAVGAARGRLLEPGIRGDAAAAGDP
jgi:hypothetical protein